jgi:threonine dehydrogenase-like Zn-dependent dehydrogenase
VERPAQRFEIPIEDVPEAYEKFAQRTDGYTKVLIKREMRAA